MKIVINKCYGGFSLSPLAVKLLAELKGQQCFFFKDMDRTNCKQIAIEELADSMFWSAYNVPNPYEVAIDTKNWSNMSMEEKEASNKSWEAITLTSRPEDRADPDLVKVVEELGEAAYGSFANLNVIEIPDGIDWKIEEYDGQECIAEKHQTWG